MGRPRLFAAVSAGAMDSMVSHYTAAKKIRRDDAYTPGGRAGARPNRAAIAYTAALKGAFKGLPVIIGGIEASLRRLAHYDYWDDAVRRSMLVDSKADLLVYGMGEAPLLEIARRASAGEPLPAMTEIRGTAYMAAEDPQGSLCLPSFESVQTDLEVFGEAFCLAAGEANPFSAKTLAQRHGNRFLVVNPPSLPLTEGELDRLYALPFNRLPHPAYQEPIPAFEQIRFSITTHRGCFGGCAFCAITAHQGKFIQSRSEISILTEIERITGIPGFRGTISDVGGPTANMYGLACGHPSAGEQCRRDSCLFPRRCRHLRTDDRRAVRLLEQIRSLTGVRHVFVASGVRYDLLEEQTEYFEALLAHHIGGLLKVAPEALCDRVTTLMHKPGTDTFTTFLHWFREGNRQSGSRQGIVPYLMAGHPGTTIDDMVDTAIYLRQNDLRVEQVQEFTPTPGTLATCIYHTGHDPFSGEAVHVPRSARERRLQKALLLWHRPESRADIVAALQACGREREAAILLGSAGEKVERIARFRK